MKQEQNSRYTAYNGLMTRAKKLDQLKDFNERLRSALSG